MEINDTRFLEFAYRIAMSDSTDPRTQNGVYICSNYCAVTAGNRFPLGVKEPSERWKPPLKYAYVEHAERRAIYQAARTGQRTVGATMFVPWFACMACARGIIEAGIRRVVGHNAPFHNHPRWNAEIKMADEMLLEAGVKIERITYKFVGIKILFDGQEVEP